MYVVNNRALKYKMPSDIYLEKVNFNSNFTLYKN